MPATFHSMLAAFPSHFAAGKCFLQQVFDRCAMSVTAASSFSPPSATTPRLAFFAKKGLRHSVWTSAVAWSAYYSLRIEFADHQARYYNRVGARLGGDELALLSDGRSMDRLQLYVAAVEANGENFYAHHNLAVTLGSEETIVIHAGSENERKIDRKMCYVEAIRLDPRFASAYCNLGKALKPGESVTLHNGRTMTSADLYAEALRIDPVHSAALSYLALESAGSSSLTSLPDGRCLTRTELLLDSLAANPTNSMSLGLLAEDFDAITAEEAGASTTRAPLPPASATPERRRCIQLRNGKCTGKVQLQFESMVNDPALAVGATWSANRLTLRGGDWNRRVHSAAQSE